MKNERKILKNMDWKKKGLKKTERDINRRIWIKKKFKKSRNELWSYNERDLKWEKEGRTVPCSEMVRVNIE